VTFFFLVFSGSSIFLFIYVEKHRGKRKYEYVLIMKSTSMIHLNIKYIVFAGNCVVVGRERTSYIYIYIYIYAFDSRHITIEEQ